MEHDPGGGDEIAYCARLKAILCAGFSRSRSATGSPEQADERGLGAAGDQQRDRERRRRRRLALGAARVDLQRHELAEQRADGEHEQLVLGRAAQLPCRARRENAAAATAPRAVTAAT